MGQILHGSATTTEAQLEGELAAAGTFLDPKVCIESVDR
jgi:hypothetical protein